MERSEIEIVSAFNDAINRADLPALSELMTDDHQFVDAAGGRVSGKEACVAAWASFFESFPGYRNELDSIDLVASGQVVASGRSVCRVEILDGPARWQAEVRDGLVTEWRVEDPVSG